MATIERRRWRRSMEYGTAQRKRRLAEKTLTERQPYMRFCRICGKEFNTAYKFAKLCSDECRDLAREIQKEAMRVKRTPEEQAEADRRRRENLSKAAKAMWARRKAGQKKPVPEVKPVTSANLEDYRQPHARGYGNDFVVRRDFEHMIDRPGFLLPPSTHTRRIKSPITLILMALRVGQSAVFRVEGATRVGYKDHRKWPLLYKRASVSVKYLTTAHGMEYMRRTNNNDEVRFTRLK